MALPHFGRQECSIQRDRVYKEQVTRDSTFPDDSRIRWDRAIARIASKMCHHCLTRENEITIPGDYTQHLESNNGNYGKLDICQKCHLVYYCSEKCKEADSSGHQEWCCNHSSKTIKKTKNLQSPMSFVVKF